MGSPAGTKVGAGGVVDAEHERQRSLQWCDRAAERLGVKVGSQITFVAQDTQIW